MNELMFGEFAFSNAESPEKVKELQKALTVGYGMEPSTQTGFGATRVQSLEKTVKDMVPRMEDVAFYKAIRKGKATSTVERFATANEVGSANFYAEGGIPEEFDEDLRQEFEQVKYIGAVGKVPIPATVVKSITNNIDKVTKLKAAAILRKVDVEMWFGNAGQVPLEWNGYLTQFNSRVKNASENTIDLRGKRLRPETINEAGRIIAENYGRQTNLSVWMGNRAWENYTNELLAERRFMVGTSEARAVIASADKFKLAGAQGNINTDIFLRHKGETYLDRPHPKLNSAGSAFAATSAKAPATLDGTTATAAVASDSTSQLDAGTYDYAIVPVSKYGAGAAFEITGVAVTAGQKVNFTIADNGSPTGQEATAVEIYRKLASASGKDKYKFLVSFAIGDTKVDNGEHVPGTTYSFVIDWDFDQVIDFKQLLPMVKMPLATIDDSIRWLQKQYAVPLLYNPNKIVLLKNVGETAW